MAEADHICVLDTGSTDGTVEILADLGVIVRREEIDHGVSMLPATGPWS